MNALRLLIIATSSLYRHLLTACILVSVSIVLTSYFRIVSYSSQYLATESREMIYMRHDALYQRPESTTIASTASMRSEFIAHRARNSSSLRGLSNTTYFYQHRVVANDSLTVSGGHSNVQASLVDVDVRCVERICGHDTGTRADCLKLYAIIGDTSSTTLIKLPVSMIRAVDLSPCLVASGRNKTTSRRGNVDVRPKQSDRKSIDNAGIRRELMTGGQSTAVKTNTRHISVVEMSRGKESDYTKAKHDYRGGVPAGVDRYVVVGSNDSLGVIKNEGVNTGQRVNGQIVSEAGYNNTGLRFAKHSRVLRHRLIDKYSGVFNELWFRRSERSRLRWSRRRDVRPKLCDACMALNYTFVVNPVWICSNASRTKLLILILSAPTKLSSRNAIRATWGRRCRDAGSGVKCVFVVAMTTRSINKRVGHEARLKEDILWINFADHYRNLTMKTVMALNWAAQYCPDVRHVMKTDDDMYVNTDRLQLLLNKAPTQNLYGGYCWDISHPIRHKKSKWYVTSAEYSGQYFPPMCSGTGYIMSGDVVAAVTKAQKHIPFIYLEDVYIAFVMLYLHIKPVSFIGFSNYLIRYNPCNYRQIVLTSHGFGPMALLKTWKEMLAKKCVEKRKPTLPVRLFQQALPVKI